MKLELDDVKAYLERALKARNRERVAKKFIKWMFTNILTSENIVEAFQRRLDLTEVLRGSCYLDSPVIQPLAKMVMRLYWREIEDVVCNVGKIYELLLRLAPEHANLLSSNEGIEYLNEQCQKLYDYLYSYAWE